MSTPEVIDCPGPHTQRIPLAVPPRRCPRASHRIPSRRLPRGSELQRVCVPEYFRRMIIPNNTVPVSMYGPTASYSRIRPVDASVGYRDPVSSRRRSYRSTRPDFL